MVAGGVAGILYSMNGIDDKLYEDIQLLLGIHERNHSIGLSPNSWKINNGYTLPNQLIRHAENIISFKSTQSEPEWNALVSVAKKMIEILQDINSCVDSMREACRKLNEALRQANQSPEFDSIADLQKIEFAEIRNHDSLLCLLEDKKIFRPWLKTVTGFSATFLAVAKKMQSHGEDISDMKPFSDLSLSLDSIADLMNEFARLRRAARKVQKSGVPHFELYMANTMLL